MKDKFKKAGLLSFTVTQIWNKQGNNRLEFTILIKMKKHLLPVKNY